MAWVKLNNGNNIFTLNASIMCAGESDFKPYTPDFLMIGLQPGNYKIQYISGAIRSHNNHRFNNYIPQFELKWNKYYNFQDYKIENFKQFNYSFFPQLKFNVLQCEYGTLPGFTNFGTNAKKLAQAFSKGKNIPEDIYNTIYNDIKPLEFRLSKFSTISFWYTDNCAPCVEGSMTFAIYLDKELENLAVNGLSVLSFNIKNLKQKLPEYYSLQQNITNISNQIYKYQEKILEFQNNNKHIQDLSLYNTLSYYKNTIENNGLYFSYNKDYTKQYLENTYWKITKINKIVLFNILTEIKNNKSIPLFKNVYTLIPSKSKYLTGTIILVDKYDDINNISYSFIESENISEYTFEITQSKIVKFENIDAYLYVGNITYDELINKNLNNNIIQQNDEIVINYVKKLIPDENLVFDNLHENLIIKNDVLINSDFYIYIIFDDNQSNIISGIIKIISNIQQKMLNNNFQKVMGPFNNIEDAILEVKKYCFINEYQFEEIDNITYVFGKENNEDLNNV